MRDVETIIKNRDNLKEAIRKIKNKISDVRGDTIKWGEMSNDDQRICDRLERLKINYLNQMKALNFVLNEDDWLVTYEYDIYYKDFSEFFAKINIR